MKRSIRTLGSKKALGGLVLAGCLMTWLYVRGADSPEAREVKAQALRQARRVESLEVLYKLEARSGLTPDQLRALPDHRNQLFLPVETRREAFKGDHRYRRQVLPERVQWLAPTDSFGLVPPQEPDPNAPEPVRAQQKRLKDEYARATAAMKATEARGMTLRKKDPGLRDLMERDETRAYNGRSLWMRRPVTEKQDEYQTWSVKSQARWFGHSPYQSAVGLQANDPTQKDPMADKIQAAFRVAEWINDQAYAVEEKTEVVDGSTCVVLSGSWNSMLKPSLVFGNLGDRIWLDRDHGLAVRRRELTRDGQPNRCWENSDFREVAPGLWLPFTVRVDHFSADAPPGWQGKPVLTDTIRVESVEVNRVADDLFDMPVPKKGDRVEDLRGMF